MFATFFSLFVFILILGENSADTTVHPIFLLLYKQTNLLLQFVQMLTCHLQHKGKQMSSTSLACTLKATVLVHF